MQLQNTENDIQLKAPAEKATSILEHIFSAIYEIWIICLTIFFLIQIFKMLPLLIQLQFFLSVRECVNIILTDLNITIQEIISKLPLKELNLQEIKLQEIKPDNTRQKVIIGLLAAVLFAIMVFGNNI